MSLLSSLKHEIKSLTGQITSIKKEVNCSYAWYGNNYGGFYVHPDTLSSKSIVYSFGIGEDLSFDKNIMEKHGSEVFAFDPTPKSINWIRNQRLPNNFHFFDYGIGEETGLVNFHLPKHSDHVSGSVLTHKNVTTQNTVSVPMRSFSDITSQLGHTHIDVLKMDIEGSEYLIIDQILASPVKIGQLLIEIHERFFTDGKIRTRNFLKSLNKHGYRVFAISESFEEISFIKTSES